MPQKSGRMSFSVYRFICTATYLFLILAKGLYAEDTIVKAAESGNYQKVKAFLDGGVNVDFSDSKYKTALMKAAAGGFTDIVTILLDHKADVNLSDKDHRTALIRACESGYLDIVVKLLVAGADPNIADKDRRTPVMVALQSKQWSVVRKLLEYKPDISLTDNNGGDATVYAAGVAPLEIFKLFESQDTSNYERLAKASLGYDNSQVFYYIVAEKQLDLNAAFDAGGNSPLHIAASHCYSDLIDSLLSKGANVNTKNHAGDTPLHLAVRSQNAECISTLLKAGANPYSTNGSNETPVDIAEKTADSPHTMDDTRRARDIAELLVNWDSKSTSSDGTTSSEAPVRMTATVQVCEATMNPDLDMPIKSDFGVHVGCRVWNEGREATAHVLISVFEFGAVTARSKKDIYVRYRENGYVDDVLWDAKFADRFQCTCEIVP